MTPTELITERKNLRLSQKGLAEALGIHPTIVNRWERGRAKIPPYMRFTMDGLAGWLYVSRAITRPITVGRFNRPKSLTESEQIERYGRLID